MPKARSPPLWGLGFAPPLETICNVGKSLKENEMREHSRLVLGLFAFMLVIALPVIYLAGCSSGGGSDLSTPPPEFVGTWVTPLGGGNTLTLTFTATTWTSFAGVLTGDYENAAGTFILDEQAKHILATVGSESWGGVLPPSTPLAPGEKLYFLYTLSGTTLTMAMDLTGYPVDLSSANVFTKQ